MTTTLTTKEVAEKLDTDPRTLRRFLRSQASPVREVGKGNRYHIEARQFRTLKKAFIRWHSSHTRQQAA